LVAAGCGVCPPATLRHQQPGHLGLQPVPRAVGTEQGLGRLAHGTDDALGLAL
jgi:hypothetical protein